ncbi:MAG: choice-of-anchor L domain-containing protein [Flavobacteriales bacterium]|nr:choice-of-anchor L domain-containing protein [Flavobacteriales bacterium]
MKFIKLYLTGLAAVCIALTGFSQLSVTTNANSDDLANSILGDNSGITILSTSYTGSDLGAGTFEGGDFGIAEGILLTSGEATTAIGPNTSNGAGNGMGEPGDPDLNAIVAPFSTNDASILEIEFIPDASTLEFSYVFGSEEYNEYVCSSFNDVFAFFVSGGIYENENIALLPGTDPPVPVSINNVNNGSVGSNGSDSNCDENNLANSAFYIDNAEGENIEYDGHTVVLTATINLEPGETYTIRLAIADAGDSVLDSGVFIEGGSFVAVEYDCPDLQVDFGDSCDDGNDETENDQYNESCECVGTPIGEEFDCPEFEANFEDPCDDGNDETENDQYNESCECVGEPIDVDDCPELGGDIGDVCFIDGVAGEIVEGCACQIDTNVEECESYQYFLSDVNDNASDIYRVVVSGDDANMTWLKTIDYEVHIAYSEDEELLYLVRKSDGSFRTLDVSVVDGAMSDETVLESPISGSVTAAINHDGKLVVGSQDTGEISIVNDDGSLNFYGNGPIQGGDIAFGIDGLPYLATRAGNGGLYNIAFGMMLTDNLPNTVTGLAVMPSGNLLYSANGSAALTGRAPDGSDNGVSLNLILDGESFTHTNGDLAYGCVDSEDVEECTDFAYYYMADNTPGYEQGTVFGGEIVGSEFVLTELFSVGFSAHMALNTNDGNIYAIAGAGDVLKTFDADGNELNSVSIDLSQAYALAYNEDDGLVYAGSANADEVYAIDPADGTTFVFAPDVPVNGGDLFFNSDGDLFLVERVNNGSSRLYNISSGDDVFVADLAPSVNGAALTAAEGIIVASGNGSNTFPTYDGDGNPLEVLDAVDDAGEPFPVVDGDMASGCLIDPFGGETPGQCYATEVIEYVEGASSSGGSIAANRTDANQALNEPERTDELVFVSLGYGGSLTLAFDGFIPNEEGDDIEVVETTYGNNSCDSYPEFADVYFSVDGINYEFAKTICRADNFVDISDANEDWLFANFVRIVNSETSTTPDAFDVDGVVALHNCEDEEETAIAEESAPDAVAASEPMAELSSFPNPTPGNSQVTFTIAETQRATLEVYDMQGRSVGQLFNADANAGQEYRFDFNASPLPEGVYVYRLTTESEVVIEKFMVTK